MVLKPPANLLTSNIQEQLDYFTSAGLHTIIYARKDLSIEQTFDFFNKMANIKLLKDEKELEDLLFEIETGMDLICVLGA
jgi:hypothetical protein